MANGPPFALVTGCSSGIGEQLAIAFAAKGITVLATARRVESLQDITSKYANIEAFALELGSMASIDKLKAEIDNRTGGRLDYLVNNAGTHYAATALDLDVEEAAKLFAVNVFAVMKLCQLFIPLLCEAPHGRIVQIGSVTRAVPVVWQAAYNASKAALSQYTKTLRLEIAPFGIDVIEVVAGFVRSNILHHGLYAPENSLYLPIKGTIERIKYEGNANGMNTREFSRIVVDKVTCRRPSLEIWEGTLAWRLRLLVTLWPLRFMSVILEKDSEVTKDPRGVYLTGDAIRILYDLGLGNEVPTIGHDSPDLSPVGSRILPEEVYNLFWPEGWHFCGPPGKATATGRFGPTEDRTWRHELCQSHWNDSMDAESLFWEHIKPMITRERDDNRGCEFPGSVQFPEDCIEILRCRPYRFTHKVVNRWFHKRVILIGDAAHVFPPFAGQGIASGVRDAHQLAWRLALLLRTKHQGEALANGTLESWAVERRKSVDDAAMFSMLNGYLCNNKPSIWLRGLLLLAMFLESSRFLFQLPDPQAIVERRGFTNVRGGFFLENYHGGARLTQIYVQSDKVKAVLSDTLLRPCDSIFTILAICNGGDDGRIHKDAKEAVGRSGIDPAIVSESSVVLLNPNHSGSAIESTELDNGDQIHAFSPAVHPNGQARTNPQQDGHSYMDRLGRSTQFAILRPDFFVFSCCKNVIELERCLSLLKKQLAL
ncbi:hypothetical protein TrVFT333_002432 [Trichoderma virens FT-333]|nr:hypothetical protein TrVFT333_002432 [Trichoderma virens FT-333]